MENEKKEKSTQQQGSHGAWGATVWMNGLTSACQLLYTIALLGPLVFQTVFRVREQGFALDSHFTPGSTVHPNSCVKLQAH